ETCRAVIAVVPVVALGQGVTVVLPGQGGDTEFGTSVFAGPGRCQQPLRVRFASYGYCVLLILFVVPLLGKTVYSLNGRSGVSIRRKEERSIPAPLLDKNKIGDYDDCRRTYFRCGCFKEVGSRLRGRQGKS